MTTLRVILILVSLAFSLYAQSAAELGYQARRAEKKKEFSKAYLLYSQAAVLDPKNQDYWVHCQLLRTKALMEQKSLPVSNLSETTIVENAEKVLGSIAPEDLREAGRPQPPRELKANPDRKSFDLRAPPKALFEKVAEAYGLDVVFDGDFPTAGSPIAFHLDDVDYRVAIRALEAATGSFTFPLGEKLFMAAKDTPQKRTEIEPTAAITIPIPDPVTVQEAQELARSVQQALEVPKFAVDSTRRLVFIRDRVSKVYAAQALFQQLLSLKAQVMIEVEFVEVDENSSLSYGMNLPTKFSLGLFGSLPRWLTASPAQSGFLKFLTLGGGASLIGIGVMDAQMFASMTQSNSTTLLRTQLRSSDGQPAQLHVGDRYPIVSTQYMGGDVVGAKGQIYAPPPSFNFEDLGVIIKVTPKVNGPRRMTLGLESEFKVLTGQALNGIPVISDRKFNSTISLQEGEWAVVAGLLSSSDARSISGLYGLSSLPLLGPLVRQNSRDKSKSEVLIVIRPRRVGLPGDEMVKTRTFWIGTESRVASPL